MPWPMGFLIFGIFLLQPPLLAKISLYPKIEPYRTGLLHVHAIPIGSRNNRVLKKKRTTGD